MLVCVHLNDTKHRVYGRTGIEKCSFGQTPININLSPSSHPRSFTGSCFYDYSND